MLDLNKCYLVFALSMSMIGSCSLQYGYSFKLENNGYSVYMNSTFHGHAPYVNGSLNLGRGNTHVHTKRCRVNNDSATYMWNCRLGHIDVKRMKKPHADGLLESLDYESFDACEPFLFWQDD